MKKLKWVVMMMLVVGLLAGAAATVAAQEEAQPPRLDHRGPRGVAGEVTAKADNSLTITAVTRDEETVEIVVNVSDETTIVLMATQSEGTLDDIAVGDHVKVDGPRNEDGSVDAVHIVVEPDGERLGGRVAAVDGSTITVENREGEQATIVVDAGTTFWVGRGEEGILKEGGPEEGSLDEGSLEDVTEGKFVEAFGELQEDGSLAANVVFVKNGPPHPPHGPGGPGGRGGPGGPRPGAPFDGAYQAGADDL
jgi:hypothetical protein